MLLFSETAQAQAARDLGYNIAGYAEELYEGAEILIHDTMWMHVNHDGVTDPKYMNLYVTGKVLEIKPIVLQYDDEGRGILGDVLDDEYADYYSDGGRTLALKVSSKPHFVVHFIMQTEDGLQMTKSFGRGYELFMKVPV